MPLLLMPYTLGVQLVASAPVAGQGAAYWGKRKRFLMYLLTTIVFALVLP